MIFSKEKTILAYTVEKCPKCEKLNKRDFTKGDVLFTNSSKCSFCGEVTTIEKIFGEVLE
jgi:translation initiation factor 2 beta subunit (eIF-2beta)/eIF-5